MPGPLTREEFQNALWSMIGHGQLKNIVDGVKNDVGNAYGFGKATDTTGADQPDSSAFLGYQPPQAPDWEPEIGPISPIGPISGGGGSWNDNPTGFLADYRANYAANEQKIHDKYQAFRDADAMRKAGVPAPNSVDWTPRGMAGKDLGESYASPIVPTTDTGRQGVYAPITRLTDKLLGPPVTDWGGAETGIPWNIRDVIATPPQQPSPSTDATIAAARAKALADSQARFDAMDAGTPPAQTVSDQLPATEPAKTPLISPPGNPFERWAAEFTAVHGRAPTDYDAMVKQKMDQRLRPGQIPTRQDWERLTRDLNEQGTGGPLEVPDFSPGDGPNGGRPTPNIGSISPTGPITTATRTPAAGTTPTTSVQFPASEINRYLSQEFVVKQGTKHPLEGQGDAIATMANTYKVDPTLLLAFVEAAGAKIKDVGAVDAAARSMQGWRPTPEVLRIQQAIRDNYGSKNQTQAKTIQAGPTSVGQYKDVPNGIGGQPSVTPTGIDAYLSTEYNGASPLRGKGTAIYEAGRQNGVDPATLLAIMEHENAVGTASGVATNANNYGSLAFSDAQTAAWLGADPTRTVAGSDGGRFLVFPTPEAGINALAKLLGQSSVYKPLTTWGALSNVFSSNGRGDSPTWGEETGMIANAIKQKYGQR